MQTVPAIAPSPPGRQHLQRGWSPCAGSRRRIRAAPGRAWSRAGGVAVAVATRRCPPATRLTSASRPASVIAGRRPKSRAGRSADRGQAVRRRCRGAPGRSGPRGAVSVAAELAMCRTSGRTPACSASSTASSNALELRRRWTGGPARRRRRSGTTARRPRRALGLRPRARPRPASGQSAGVAPPRDSPVSAFRCSRAGRPPVRAAAAISSTSQHRGRRQVDVRGDGLRRTARPGRKPARMRRVDTGRAQRHRLGQEGDAQPRGAAGQRGPGARHHAVAVRRPP